MSIEAMATVLHHSQMTGTAKLLLLGIANHEGDGGAFPSVATLAKYTGTSERRVQQLISELRASGELSVSPSAGPAGTNVYRVQVSCPDDCDRSSNHRGGEARFTGGVKSSSPRGVKPTSPEPSLEPSMNRKRRGHRLPEGWKPTPEMLEWAVKEFPTVDIQMQTDAFIDYWLGKAVDNQKQDWNRTWRNWIRNAYLRWGNRRSSSPVESNMAVVRKYQQGQLSG